MISQAQLKELLEYNPDTGVFTWIKLIGGIKAGSVAGCKNNEGYVCITVKQRSYKAHRIAHLYMTGKFPKNDIYHINHITVNKQWNFVLIDNNATVGKLVLQLFIINN